MKKFFFLLLILCSMLAYTQRERTVDFGQQNIEELKMTHYPKDSLAPALVIMEQANYYLDDLNDFSLVTDFYHRVKIFNKDKGQKYANIVIYTRKDDVIKDIKGLTYNLVDNTINTASLNPSDIFTVPVSEYYNKTTFTLPNIQDGCVVEYKYKIIESTLNIRDWYFQSTEIPKLESRYDLAVMGNYQYNTRLVGFQSLSTNIAKTETECLTLPDQDDFIRRRKVPCAWYSYGVSSVPALKEEAYMLSPKNYLSRISFDLKSKISMVEKRGVSSYQQGVEKRVENFTKTWDDADKTLKIDFLNNQGSKKSYFKKKLPESVFEMDNELEKAKAIYTYIQNHFMWNNRYWNPGNIHVKENFDTQTGSVDEINLSLYNSLQAADIESYITLVSTRENGIPTKLFPTLEDFNYLIVKVVINGEDYFLDATDKTLPFGLIPFKCLNGEARVFDFKKGSYWQDLKVQKPSVKRISKTIDFSDEGDTRSEVNIVSDGYYATEIRSEIANKGKEEYLIKKEKGLIDSEIEDYQAEYLTDLDKPVVETIKILSDVNLLEIKSLRVYPIFDRITENPFKLNERLYPVDFGYTQSVSERISITIPAQYQFVKIPEEAGFKLPNDTGSFLFKVQQKGNTVNLFLKTQISKHVFTNQEYFYLKKFYQEMIKIHNSFLLIEKK